ncbi:hypothetical protein EJB05_57286, partial [Eragrostis curvula]
MPSSIIFGTRSLSTKTAAANVENKATRRPNLATRSSTQLMDTSATTHLILLDTTISSMRPSIAAGKPPASLPMSERSPSGPMPSGKETMLIPAGPAAPASPPASMALTMRSWLMSVFTKSTSMPCSTSRWASSMSGLTWPWRGHGSIMTRGRGGGGVASTAMDWRLFRSARAFVLEWFTATWDGDREALSRGHPPTWPVLLFKMPSSMQTETRSAVAIDPIHPAGVAFQDDLIIASKVAPARSAIQIGHPFQWRTQEFFLVKV